MRRIRAFLIRLGGFFTKGRWERELDAELASNLELHVEDNIRKGMPPEEARRAALRQFGRISAAKEAYRDRRSLPGLESLAQDFRYAGRTFARSPGFVAVAVLTLALGVGANSAVFSLVYAVLWRPLPYEEPERLIAIWDVPNLSFNAREMLATDPVNFLHSLGSLPSLEGIAGFQHQGFVLRGAGDPGSVRAAEVTANLFDVLGIKMAVGRNFLAEEEEKLSDVVLLSHELWQRRFGGNPDVIGRSITLSGYLGDRILTVVGVVPQDFWFSGAANTAVWTLMSHNRNYPRSLGWDPSLTIARLKEGRHLSQAAVELAAVKEQILTSGRAKGREALSVKSLRDHLTDSFRADLLVLLGAVGFVVLIACANLANLLLTRGIGRRHEMGVRAVVGASRSRLLQQLLTESLLLVVLGGAAGLLVAYGGIAFLRSIPFQRVPRLEDAVLDGTAIAFTLGLSPIAGIMATLLPALRVSQVRIKGSLRSGGSGAAARASRMRNTFVVAEVALAVVLVAGAGLMVNTLLRLKTADLGFQADQALVVQLNEPPGLARDPQRSVQFHREALSALENLPGVESAALVNHAPLGAVYHLVSFEIPGRNLGGDESTLNGRMISPGYFDTLRIQLLRGRVFSESDDENAPRVAVIDEAARQQYWPVEDPIGKPILVRHRREWLPTQIIGVVGNVSQAGVRPEHRPQIYLPYTQYQGPGVEAVVRTSTDPLSLSSSVRDVMRVVNKNQPPPAIRRLIEGLEWELAEPRFYMLLLSAFAGLALLLALVGLYGVISYSVTHRTPEFGLRMALGGHRGTILGLVLGQAARLVSVGLTLGIAGALALTRALEHLLYEVEPTDPLTFFAVALLLIITALLACYIPARRAMRIDPMTALRYE